MLSLLNPFMRYISGGLLFLCIMLGIALKLEAVHAHKLEKRNAELTQLREQDRANFIAAQKAAEAQAKANVQRVQKDQERITDEVSTDYARQLAELRARFVRRPSPANPGKPQGSAVSDASPTTGSANDPAGDGLSPSERQLAAEISLRLKALQEWVRQQSQVNTN